MRDRDLQHDRLVAEIRATVDAQLQRGPAVLSWIVQEVMQSHKDIRGSDAGWHTYNSYRAVRAAARDVIRRIKQHEAEPDDLQAVLPGFTRLQREYVVERAGDQTVVLAWDLEPQEIDAKVAELYKMAEGCRRHAEELLRFKSELLVWRERMRSGSSG